MVKAVDGISFDLIKGETLGIVGESGSGKSMSMLSLLQLIQPPGEVIEGSVIYCDDNTCTDLLRLKEEEIAAIRGSKIGMVYQQAISAFNPVFKIRKQLEEAIKIHQKTFTNLDQYLVDLALKVELRDPDRILNSYPHQLSGGQLQRCMIAMAIANKPKVLIADEPTTSLDVITQKKVLALLQKLKSELGMSMIFISHDIGVIAEMADRTLVMKEGKIVEVAETNELLNNPKTNYAKALMRCRPSIKHKVYRLPTIQDYQEGYETQFDERTSMINEKAQETRKFKLMQASEILTVVDLTKSFGIERGLFKTSNKQVHAVNKVNFDVKQGEVVGVVGESGSGKSTLAKLILNLIAADEGMVSFNGVDVLQLSQKAMRPFRKQMQIIFQDVNGSLDPRMSVQSALDIVLSLDLPKSSKDERKQEIINLLSTVGLSEKYLSRLPHELSGGERQRVCIARALSLEPQLLICDECVSALDVSVQAQILNLLLDLRDERGLSILFISHDLSVINFMCDRVLIMESGMIIERGNTVDVLSKPKEHYTKALIEAIPLQSKMN